MSLEVLSTRAVAARNREQAVPIIDFLRFAKSWRAMSYCAVMTQTPQDPRSAIWRPGDVWVAVGKPLTGMGAHKVRLNEEFLFFEKGTLRTDSQQVPLAQIWDVDAMQSMVQKSRGVGSIRVHVGRGNRMEFVLLEDLPDFREGVDKINDLSRRARQAEQQRRNTQHITYQGQPAQQPYPAAAAVAPAPQKPSSEEIFGQLERLGDLRDKGYITDDDFNAKKAELLSRL